MLTVLLLTCAARAVDEAEELDIISSITEAPEEGRRLGAPFLLIAYVGLAGLGLLTTWRKPAKE